MSVRRLDDLDVDGEGCIQNTDFAINTLGFKLREQKIGDGGATVGSWLHVSALVHELALMRSTSGPRPLSSCRLLVWQSVPFAADIADILSKRDIRIETGPAKHGTTQAYFLYCFGAGSHRVEPFGDTGYLILSRTGRPSVWNVANEIDLEKSSIWFGGQLAKTFYRYGTPVVPGHSLEEMGR